MGEKYLIAGIIIIGKSRHCRIVKKIIFTVHSFEEVLVNLGRRAFLKRSATGAAVLAAGAGVLKNSAFAAAPSRFQDKSDVSFVGSSPDGTRRRMILDVLEPWRASVAAGVAGKTVLIKVNMVYWHGGVDDPTLALTHVDAVRGLIDFLRSISDAVPIIVGDSTCSPLSFGDITMIFEKAGYGDLPSEYAGVTLKDLNTLPSVECPFWTPDFSAAANQAIPIVSAFFDPNYYIISICRPKTHNCMIMTGVDKNILMGAPVNAKKVLQERVITAASDTTINIGPDSTVTLSGGSSVTLSEEVTLVPKQFMHGKNGWYSGQNTDENKCLSYNLYQLANMLYPAGQPALSVLDAWEGMEGDGPVAGASVMQYCAVAGSDPLAVDRLCAKLMGFSDTPADPVNSAAPSYTDMRTLVWMSNAGLGNYDLNNISFILGSLQELEGYVKTYEMSPNFTGDPSYATEWTGGPPPEVMKEIGIRESRFLDPKPYLAPQLNKRITGGRIVVDFSLPVTQHVHLGIYTLKGKEVRRLGNETLPSGRYTVVWDGCNARGSRVPSGRYIIKLGFGSRSMCDRITMVR